MLSLVLYFLTFVREFRHVSVKHEVKIIRPIAPQVDVAQQVDLVV